jgi:hypothetical protein
LPGRVRGDWPIPNAHRPQPPSEGVPVSTVVIADQIISVLRPTGRPPLVAAQSTRPSDAT